MKKFSFLLAMMLVLALAGNAFAAQAILGKPSAAEKASYSATTKSAGQEVIDVADDQSKFQKLLPTNKFNADGKTNYPYEIYLPNEENPESYRIHSNYTKNTDACAACHATHTAVGGSLLQWYSVYDTCMACHDGTVTSTYNVQGGEIGSTGNPTYGGMFDHSDASASNHNVTGAMEIAAAPGGSVVAETTNPLVHGKAEEKTRWAVEFGCESCHTPHGQGGNARILHPDANYAATAAAEARTVSFEYVVSSVNSFVYDKDPSQPDAKKVMILKGYPYAPEIAGLDDTVGYSVYNGLGVSKVVYTNAAGVMSDAHVAAAAQAQDFSDVTIENGIAALTVKMNIGGYLTDGETVQHVAGMNGFCGACHTDYNTETYKNEKGEVSGSAEAETGAYSKAHRHQVGFYAGYFEVEDANMVFESFKMECLTCHVAHGTSTDYWERTIGEEDGATGYLANEDLVELAGSSALKRVPNMGTCEACHDKTDGNEGYSANTMQADVTPTAAIADATLVTYALGDTVLAADQNWVGSATCQNCHAEYVTGWSLTKHKTSTRSSSGCGTSGTGEDKFSCHANGNLAMSKPASGLFATGSADFGITCESCHGSGANHITAPSSKNIINTGKAAFADQVGMCARCHDVYSFGTELAPDGTTAVPMFKGVWNGTDDNSTQFSVNDFFSNRLGSEHAGGAWKYADSKHFDKQIASCTTCHDPHGKNSDNKALRLTYAQVCSSCHDSAGLLADTMGGNFGHTALNRDHSFTFGMEGKSGANNVPATATFALEESGGITLNGSDYEISKAAGATITVSGLAVLDKNGDPVDASLKGGFFAVGDDKHGDWLNIVATDEVNGVFNVPVYAGNNAAKNATELEVTYFNTTKPDATYSVVIKIVN